MTRSSLAAARAAAAKVRASLGARPEIAGIGVGRHEDGYAVKVNLTVPCAAVPAEMDGVPVRSEVIGPVRKRARP
jgi:hypothetical protein